MGQFFFDAECIYEILKPYLKLVMGGRTDGKAQSNMPLNIFAHLSQRLMGELIVYQSLCRPSVNIFQTSSPLKPLGHLNYISYEDSYGHRNESLFKWSWSHGQDGRHAHI